MLFRSVGVLPVAVGVGLVARAGRDPHPAVGGVGLPAAVRRQRVVEDADVRRRVGRRHHVEVDVGPGGIGGVGNSFERNDCVSFNCFLAISQVIESVLQPFNM